MRKIEGCPRWSAYQLWYGRNIPEKKRINWFLVFWVAVLVLVAYLVFSEAPVLKTHYKSHYTKKEKSFISFFKKHGSPVPEEMAVAVCKTKKPALMAALAVKESNGNPKAIGDSGKAKGAFQVWSKHWGKVPDTATEQALQAERILNELVAESPQGSLLQGLARYNGGNTPPRDSYRYADHVIRIRRTLL